MTSQNGLKIFIFAHLVSSDERQPLTNIKPKTISYFDQETQLWQCQNLLLKIEFMQISLYYISRLNQDIEELFFSFEPVSRSSFSDRHQISNNVYFEFSL